MSRSRRKVKKEKWYCTCWLCDGSGRKKKHKDRTQQPDPELKQELKAA